MTKGKRSRKALGRQGRYHCFSASQKGMTCFHAPQKIRMLLHSSLTTGAEQRVNHQPYYSQSCVITEVLLGAPLSTEAEIILRVHNHFLPPSGHRNKSIFSPSCNRAGSCYGHYPLVSEQEWSTPLPHMLPHLQVRNPGPQCGGGTRLEVSKSVTRLRRESLTLSNPNQIKRLVQE